MPMAHPSGGGFSGDGNVTPDADECPRADLVGNVGGGPVGEKALADDPRSRRTPFGNPGCPPLAIEVEVPEPSDRTEISHL